MSMQLFERIVRTKFPHELIKFWHENGRHFAKLRGGVRLSTNSNCRRILVENGSHYCHHYHWDPAAEGLC